MSCSCQYYPFVTNTPCKSCVNVAAVASTNEITQKRIWNQVRVASSLYAMNKASFTSAANRLASGNNVNWNQMSDRTLAAVQPTIHSTRGNSIKNTLTSGRPGAATPGGIGVDVKHDSYARYLNRKKASNLKTQTNNVSVAVKGNKISSFGLVANNINCCH